MGSCGLGQRSGQEWAGEDRNYRIAQGCPPVETTSGAGKELPSGHQQQKAPPMLPLLLPRGLNNQHQPDARLWVKSLPLLLDSYRTQKKRLSLTKMGRTALHQRVNPFCLCCRGLPCENENQAEFGLFASANEESSVSALWEDASVKRQRGK